MANKVFQLLGEIVIEYNSGNIDKAKKDAEALKSSLEGIETEAEDAGDALQNTGNAGSNSLGKESKLGAATIWLGNALYGLTMKAAILGKQLISAGMEYNAAIEGYETNFTTLLEGDAERAKQLIKDLETLAMESPFDLTDTAKAAQDLLIYGTAVDDIIPTIKMMGDITLGSTERMSRLALAYNQMLGKGKLMAQEQNQMTEAAVPIVDIVIDYYRKTNPIFHGLGEEAARELYDGWREEGLISAKDVQAALFEATQEGGRFYGGMARAMETYEGKTQMAAEAGNKAVGKLFEPFFEVYKDDVLPNLTKALQNLGEWAVKNEDALKGFAESLASIANFALSPNWDGFMEATLTTWVNTVKPTLEKTLTLVIGVEVDFPTIGSILDGIIEDYEKTLKEFPGFSDVADFIKIGDKSILDLYEEYKKAKKTGIFDGKSNSLTLGDVISGNVSTGTATGNGVYEYKFDGESNGTSLVDFISDALNDAIGRKVFTGTATGSGMYEYKYKQSNNVNGWGQPNGMNGAYGFYGDYGIGEALNQFNAGTSGKLSQIISILSNILIAVNRSTPLNIRTLSAHINTQLGRTLQRTVL